MYLAFSVAALPCAWLGVSELLFYRAHPEMLQERDTALLVFAAMVAVRVMGWALGLAALLVLYFLVSGPRRVRLSASALVLAWLLMLASAIMFDTGPVNSMARLYWDAVPFVALSILPWICAVIRARSPSADRLAP